MRGPKKQKGMDYNADIPFEKQPSIGFYDTSEESSRNYQAPIGKTITALNGGKKARDEAVQEGKGKRNRSENDNNNKNSNEKDPFGTPTAGKEMEQIRKLREAEQISKRRKLNLPDAQVGESELEEIVKLGRSGMLSRELVQGDDDAATKGLLGEYEALERAKNARTPMVAPEDDAIMREARNLRNRTEAQTPLLGDANAPIHQATSNQGASSRGGRSGVTAQTPNPLLTPAHPAGRVGRLGDPGATPMSVRGTPRTEVGGNGVGVGQTPMRTPFRDSLGLNEDTSSSTIGDTPASVSSTLTSARAERYARANAKRELELGLKGLPTPKNDFELVMDEDQEKSSSLTAGQDADVDLLQDEDELGIAASQEDATERDARIEKLKEQRRLKELSRRTRVVQLGLPRPANVDVNIMIDSIRSITTSSSTVETGTGTQAEARKLIEEEMVRLVRHDSIVHPISGSKSAGGSRSDLAILPDEYVDSAKNMIHVELATNLGFPGANHSTVKRMIDSILVEGQEHDDSGDGGGVSENLKSFEKVLADQRGSLVWHPDEKVWVQRSKARLSDRDLIRGKASQLEDLKASMSEKSLMASKDERKLSKILGGYSARCISLGNGLKTCYSELVQNSFDLNVFKRLKVGEVSAIPERIDSANREVQGLERGYEIAQFRWKELDDRKRLLQEEIETLQSEIDMMEAEKLNDEVLRREEEQEGEQGVVGDGVAAEEGKQVNGVGDGGNETKPDEEGGPDGEGVGVGQMRE